ncbi:MAG: hypothetical protein QXK65_01765 [Candidatus Micrarchaeaceae archaeon]
MLDRVAKEFGIASKYERALLVMVTCAAMLFLLYFGLYISRSGRLLSTDFILTAITVGFLIISSYAYKTHAELQKRDKAMIMIAITVSAAIIVLLG